ncbi:MAG: TIGR03790 family protein [Candidatus Brocadiae bacterium]|nr:TIGR03790 family protein [Candidatus Brocadiia bacterium]
MRPAAWFALFLALALPVRAGGGPENVLVVQNDLCPDSVDLARFYMEKRDVPRHQVVHVAIPGGAKKDDKKDPKGKPPPPASGEWAPRESFATFDEYRTLLETPVKDWLAAHPDAKITVVLLTRGIPVCTPVKNATTNEIVRATTHILAGMFVEKDDLRTGPAGHQGSGSPFYREDVSIDPAEPLKGEWKLLPVGHFDAFNVADARKSLEQAILSDGKRPDGTVYLGQSKEGDPRGMYSPNFPKLSEFVAGLGGKAEIVPHDPGGVLLAGRKDVALYMFGQAKWEESFPAKNTYQPGCLVDNITSVALTWRCFVDGYNGGQTPMTHFLAAGATVIHGCVREPTTGAWDPEYLHLRRFYSGYNVLESFYLGHPWFPWMNLVAGDPLTQPFAQRPVVTAELTGEKGAQALNVDAKTTREGAGIRAIRVYADGVLLGEAQSGRPFALPTTWDPLVNSWTAVAIDDSKFRTQGSASAPPLAKDASRVTVKFDSALKGTASFRVTHSGKEPVLIWASPGVKGRTGVVKGTRLKLELEDETKGARVEFWVKNAKEGSGPIRVDVPGKKK